MRYRHWQWNFSILHVFCLTILWLAVFFAKKPSSWRDFATSLQHKRQEFRVAHLIGSIDIENKVRVKNIHGTRVESPSDNLVYKKKV